MKIATYNLRKGGSQRVHWAKMIEDYGVDLLLFQESYPHDEHLPPLFFRNVQNQSVWELAEKNRWGSAVFSKTGTLKPITVPGFTGWVVGAQISGAAWQTNVGDPLMVFSIHAPSRGQSYQKQINKLLDEISRITDGREVVVGGDFNLTVSHWCGSERPTSKHDLAIQARLADEFDLINCWQETHSDQPLCQTLRWSRDHTVAYHCDGIFVPKSWRNRLQSCEVLSDPEWDRLSDHNPVIATFS